MVIVKLVFMTTNSIIYNFGQCARIGVRFGPLFSSPPPRNDLGVGGPGVLVEQGVLHVGDINDLGAGLLENYYIHNYNFVYFR